MSNFLNNNTGFFQGGKSFGGRGFIQPLMESLQGLGQNLGNSGTVSANPNTNDAKAFDGVIRDANGLPIQDEPIPMKRKRKMYMPTFQNNKFQDYNNQIKQDYTNQGGSL